MGYCNLFTVVVALLSAQRSLGVSDPVMEVTLSKNPVMVGENLIIYCRIKPFREGSVVQWYKWLGDEVDLIGSLDSLNHPYKFRYIASYKRYGQTGLHTLNITVTREEDSGNVRCVLPKGKSVPKRIGKDVVVNVSSKVDSVHFVNFTDGDTIEFTEGIPSPIKCILNGTTMEPTVRVTIGQTDYSPQFIKLVSKKAMCTGSQFVRDCSIHSLTTITAYDNAFSASWKDHGKRMRCEGTVPGFSATAADLDVIVNYKPKFECADKVQAALHQSKAKIACKIHANPPLSSVVMKVKLGQKTHTLKVGDNMTAEGLSFKRHSGMPGQRHSTVVLTIDKVFKKHLVPYTLEAENAQGTSTFQITLTDKPISESSIVTASVMLLGLCLTSLFNLL